MKTIAQPEYFKPDLPTGYHFAKATSLEVSGFVVSCGIVSLKLALYRI
jgi:hypothetical protein